MAQIITVKSGATNEIQYPRTVKSALLNDDGTPLVFADSVSVDTKIDKTAIVDDLTTGGATNVLSAEQGKVLNSAIGQLQADMGNIDVSWDGITGKPTTFAPSTHTHNEYMPTGNAQAYNNYVSGVTDHAQLLWNHGNIIVQTPSASGTPMISFHSQGATAVGLYEDGCRLYTTGSDGRNSRRLLDTDDYNSLFQSVVNGKQSVVNAINGSLGYASGLTTSHTHDDYAWWITNRAGYMNTTALERVLPAYAAGMFAGGPLPSYFTSLALPQTWMSNVGYYATLNLPAVGTYILVKQRGSNLSLFTRVVSTGAVQKIGSVQYYYMSGTYYYGVVYKVITAGTLQLDETDGKYGVDGVYEVTSSAIAWLNGKI